MQPLKIDPFSDNPKPFKQSLEKQVFLSSAFTHPSLVPVVAKRSDFYLKPHIANVMNEIRGFSPENIVCRGSDGNHSLPPVFQLTFQMGAPGTVADGNSVVLLGRFSRPECQYLGVFRAR